MNFKISEIPLVTKVENIEQSVNQLLELCNKLSSENTALKKSNRELLQDRSALQEKNDKTKTKVEAMIGRLKAMEANSSRGLHDR